MAIRAPDGANKVVMIKQIMKNPMQRFTGTGFSSNLPVLTGTGDKNREKKTTNYKNKPSLH